MPSFSVPAFGKGNGQVKEITAFDQALIIEEIFTAEKEFITPAEVLQSENPVLQTPLAHPCSAARHQSTHPESATVLLIFLHRLQVAFGQFAQKMTDLIERMSTGIEPDDFFLAFQIVHFLPRFV